MDIPSNHTDKILEDFNKKQEFVRDALPVNWLTFSEELEQAAEVLWANSGSGQELRAEAELDRISHYRVIPAHSRSYILLAGFALENILKGLIIAGNPTLISSGELDGTLNSHNLLYLAKKLNNLKFSTDEENVLRICQDAIPYWGRYPVPLKYQGLKPEEVVNQAFRDCFRALHYRLCKSLYEIVKDGWDSGVGAKTLQMRSRRYGDIIDN